MDNKAKNCFELKSLILPNMLENSNSESQYEKDTFNTEDKVFIPASWEIAMRGFDVNIASLTDYAILNYVDKDHIATTNIDRVLSHKNDPFPYYLRDSWKNPQLKHDNLNKCESLGCYHHCESDVRAGVRPCITIDASVLKKHPSLLYKFNVKEETNSAGELVYATMEFGSFPQSIVKDDDLKSHLRNCISCHTGKQMFVGMCIMSGKEIFADIVKNDNDKYLFLGYLALGDIDNYFSAFKHGKRPKESPFLVFKFEPIRWIILNWNQLDKSINPNGTGETTEMKLMAEKVLLELPFYNGGVDNKKNKYGFMWQNSTIRAYLNGIDVNQIKSNANMEFLAEKGENFMGKGFIDVAFDEVVELQETNRKLNPYNFVFNKLTNDDMLRALVQAKVSVFLHGPSGVGKSQRVMALDPDCTKISLRPMMNPEEIDGVLNRETGDFIPPVWYKQLTQKCKDEPNKIHILFIDELTNVKPSVQSLVYGIVLERAGKDGMWKLPDNAVVVAAGNEADEYSAAYPLTNALFRRFCHLYYSVNKTDWLQWATGVDNLKPLENIKKVDSNKAKIHPAILAYISSRNEKVLNQEYDEDEPKIVTDPRKWAIASEILYSTHNPYALLPAIGENLTTDFVEFASAVNLTIEDIMDGNYNEEELKNITISSKYANIGAWTLATNDEFPVVRKFVSKVFGKEFETLFNKLWVKDSVERAEILADSLEQENQTEQNY